MTLRQNGFAFLLLAFVVAPTTAQEKTFGIWDTGTIDQDPASGQFELKGRTLIPQGETPTLTGGAYLSNGRIIARVSKGRTGVELFSLGTGTPVRRATLVPTPAGA